MKFFMIFMFCVCGIASDLRSTGIESVDNVIMPQKNEQEDDKTQKNISPVIEKFYFHDLKNLLKALEDPIQHGKLVSQIRALIVLNKGKAAEASNPMIQTWDLISSEFIKAGTDILHAVEIASDVTGVQKWFENESRKNPWKKWGLPFVLMLLCSLIGLVIGWVSKVFLKKPQVFLSNIDTKRKILFFFERLAQICLWTFPYLVFALSTYMSSISMGVKAPMIFLLQDILIGGVIVRVVHMSIKAVFSPKYPKKRVLPVSDRFAQKLCPWLFNVTGWGLWFYFIILGMKDLGLPEKVSSLFNQVLGLVITIQIIHFILHNRDSFKRFLEHSFSFEKHHEKIHHKLLNTFSHVWYIPVIIFVSIFYLAVFFNIGGGFPYLIAQTGLSLAVFFMARLIVDSIKKYRREQLTNFLSKHWPRLHSRLYRRIHSLENLIGYAVYSVAVYFQFLFWKIDLIEFFLDGSNQVYPLIKGLGKTAFIFFIAYAVWISVDIFVEQYLEKEDEKAFKIGKSMSARIRTLVPILRKVLLFFLGAMVMFVFLGTLGIDTAPILGGMAVLSLAIGLGAQELIKDLIAGFFMIIEDTVAIGDLVEVDGRRGEVEVLTIRSIRLRDDYGGAIHTIPFGQVKTFTNMSREYGYAVVNISVEYSANIAYVIQVISDAADDMMRDPIYGPLILEKIDMRGVDQFSDSAVVIQCRLKTKPGEHSKVRREFNAYIKNKFDSLGIVMPFPQQTIHLHQYTGDKS